MLDTLKCEAFEEDLEPRLVAAKSIVCTSDAYRTFFIVALLIIILYVGILPSVVITLFAVSKKRLERQSASEILGLDQGEKEVSSKPREGENSRRETHGSSPTVGTPSPTATTRLMDIRSSEESLTVGGRGHGRDDLESEASGGTRVQSSLLISVEGGMESQQPTTLKNKDGKDGALETGVTPSEGERGRQRGDGSVQRSTEDTVGPPLNFIEFYGTTRMKQKQLIRIFSFLIAGYKDKYFFCTSVSQLGGESGERGPR
uniref:Uncharacterized protein n=1 Tax=Chromera velia CCMP2878 TaxID=1169474 RepID=A0A0G4I1T3_9ALVE|eukprot:Cvel_10205.t1-p1 / transcript=Cvel_10205.t1 / gene=Cvel_10205 / organism=Chromera_velia_CCMP2878 / gene_product=hypothetical protein / transcript_product=hypothetical protein / location=Cvel_scaffold610:76505-77863(-) / protein_length=258 / sequence_SO=supercontig / SO=protein_coding / is_pseudo=false